MPKRKDILTFLTIVLILSISYLPAISNYYLHHDDAIYWQETTHGYHAYHDFNFSSGRFLGAYLHSGINLFVKKVWDLNIIRFLSILQLSLCGLIIVNRLCQYTESRLNAWLSTIILLTLPPFQIMVAYAGIGFVPQAILFSTFAVVLAEKIPVKTTPKKTFLNPWTFFSVLLLFSSFTIYQSAAPFYWGLVAILLLSYKNITFAEKKRKACNFFLVGLSATFFYAATIKFTKKFLEEFDFGLYDTGALTSDYLGKIKWFVAEPLFNTLNLWNIFPQKSHAILVVVFMVSAAFLYLLKSSKKDDLPKIFLNIIISIALLFLSFSPNLIAKGNFPFYRCCAGLITVIFVILVWSTDTWLSVILKSRKNFLFTCVALVVGVYGIYQSYTTVFYHRVGPSNTELRFIKLVIEEADLNQYKRIHLIRPDITYIKNRYDEFGTPTTYWHLNVGPMMRCVFNELGWHKKWEYYKSKLSSGTQNFDFKEPTLVIDVRALYSSQGPLHYLYEDPRGKPPEKI